MAEKIPYMPFWVCDWLTDEAVMKMSLVHQGAYFRLLCVQWVEGSIPSDVTEIADILFGDGDAFPPWEGLHQMVEGGDASEHWSALTLGRWWRHVEEYIWPVIGKNFEPEAKSADGVRLVNPRLAIVRAEALRRMADVSVKRAAAGRKGGKQRRSKTEANAKQDVYASDDASSESSKTLEPPIAKVLGGGVGEGLNGADLAAEKLRVQIEGRFDPAVGSLLDEIRKFARCGERKAEAIWLKLREPKAETFAAWERYARARGKPDAVGSMQAFDHPSEVPHEPAAKPEDPSKHRTAEERVSAVVRRYPRATRKSTPEDLAPLREYLAKKAPASGTNGKDEP